MYERIRINNNKNRSKSDFFAAFNLAAEICLAIKDFDINGRLSFFADSLFFKSIIFKPERG